jgi:hypothetical protein
MYVHTLIRNTSAMATKSNKWARPPGQDHRTLAVMAPSEPTARARATVEPGMSMATMTMMTVS